MDKKLINKMQELTKEIEELHSKLKKDKLCASDRRNIKKKIDRRMDKMDNIFSEFMCSFDYLDERLWINWI